MDQNNIVYQCITWILNWILANEGKILIGRDMIAALFEVPKVDRADIDDICEYLLGACPDQISQDEWDGVIETMQLDIRRM